VNKIEKPSSGKTINPMSIQRKGGGEVKKHDSPPDSMKNRPLMLNLVGKRG